LVSEDIFAGNAAYRMRTLRRQRAVGSHLLRQNFDWAYIERAPGRYRWDKYDRYVLTAARFRVRILAIVFNPPGWHSTAPIEGERRHGTYPPKDYAEYAAFAKRLVERYGPNGRLWRKYPTNPKFPIKSWQIWNEPNLDVYWATGASAEEYVAMLRAASAAIREADPTAEIVTAGMPQSKLGIPLLKFIDDMYKHEGKGTFNTIAINPYSRTTGELYNRLKGVRAVMNRNDDAEAQIWITELGWSDAGPKSRFRVGPDGQARLISRSFDMIGRNRVRLGLRGVIYTFWKDGRPYPPQFKDFWGLHTGLFRKNGKPKKAYSAFVHATRKLRRRR
jgi:hypothetical protein